MISTLQQKLRRQGQHRESRADYLEVWNGYSSLLEPSRESLSRPQAMLGK